MPHVELPQAEFKVVLLGDTNSGKTSLVLRFVEGTYKDHRNATIGAFFLTKRITVDSTLCCKLLLWDTSGQDQFQKLALTYYRQAAAALVCVDLCSHDPDRALLALQKWLEQVSNNITSHRIVLVVVGCKSDLVHMDHPNVLEEQIRAVADRFGASYVRTSAKNNVGVTQAFQRTASLVMQCQHDASTGRGKPIPVTVGGTSTAASGGYGNGSGAVAIRNPTKSKHHRSLSPTVKSHDPKYPHTDEARNPLHHRRALSDHDPTSPDHGNHHPFVYGSSATTAAAASNHTFPQHHYSSSSNPEYRHDKSTLMNSSASSGGRGGRETTTSTLNGFDSPPRRAGGGGGNRRGKDGYDDEVDDDPAVGAGPGGPGTSPSSPNLLHHGSKIMCDNGLLLCASGSDGASSQECVIL